MDIKSKKIQIFDTTLRDGTQGAKISLSVEDKIKIAKRLDEFGLDYIEGGWPMSNPKDFLFFQKLPKGMLNHSKLVAFGSTMRANGTAEQDLNLNKLLEAQTPAISIFGKSWLLHVEKALKTNPQENLRLIYDSVQYLKKNDKEVIYDAEHFFDGFKNDPDYVISTLIHAQNAGADVIVLCDTNGGTLTSELIQIIEVVREEISTPLGIHAHNDSDLAVANSVAAVKAGCVHVQGTINGYGERCGNANLCSIVPNLQLKLGYKCVDDKNLKQIKSLSLFVSELANMRHPHTMPFVGENAFAHKGGVHVSAVMKDSSMYEHLTPEVVGNKRKVLVSDLSDRSNIIYKAGELNIKLEDQGDNIPQIVQELKELEFDGYQYEAAEGSLELLIRRNGKDKTDHFSLKSFRILIEKNEMNQTRAEATIRVEVNSKEEHTAAEGNGPVHALDQAMRKALIKFFPEIREMYLSDYKVRVLNEKDGTAAKVRVLIESRSKESSWGTVGVSENIIEASWQALSDSFRYFLLKKELAFNVQKTAMI